MRHIVRGMLIASLSFAGSAMAASFYDFASVLSATPVTRTVYDKSARQVCRSAHAPVVSRAISPVPEEVSASGQGYSLTAIIRQDLAAAVSQPGRQCHTVAVHAPRTEIVGYRVRYRYGNATYTRTLKTQPGERIRVRVELK